MTATEHSRPTLMTRLAAVMHETWLPTPNCVAAVRNSGYLGST